MWTFPHGVLGHTEIIIITLGAYIPRVLFNGYANFTDVYINGSAKRAIVRVGTIENPKIVSWDNRF